MFHIFRWTERKTSFSRSHRDISII